MTQDRRTLSVLEPPQTADQPATRTVDDVFPDLLTAAVRQGAEDDRISIAVVEAISSDGVPSVRLGNETQPREASSLLQFPTAAAASTALLGHTVLVLLHQQTQPVILGVVAQRLWTTEGADRPAEALVKLTTTDRVAVQLDKRRIDLEASEEIRLTCGKSSLVMRRDGTVIVRGVQITTRASQSNKVKGATVSIN